MARTEVTDIEQLAYGDSVEIVTTYDDDTEHSFFGQIADIEPQQEVIEVVDGDSGEERMLYWGASDEEERVWFKLTDDEVPLTVEEKIGNSARTFQEERDALIEAYEKSKRRAQLKHEKALAALSDKWRDTTKTLEFDQLDEDTHLEEDEKN